MKKRYATSYVLEWAHAVAASLPAEHVVYDRIWVCEERCVEFLRNFESFDDFVVDVVGNEIALVSFRGLVSLLTRARGLWKSFLQSLVDYPSATSVPWALVRPGSSESVLPGVRSRVRGGAMGRSPLDAIVPDAVLRSASSWKISGEELRASGWTVRNISDVFAGHVNRYFSLKADAEEEFDTSRGDIESLTSKNENLREENGEL